MQNKPLPDAPIVQAASKEEALQFVRGLQERRRDAEAVKEYVDELPLGRLQSIGRRIMMDVMKAPQSVAEAKSAPEDSGRPEPRRGTARPGSTPRRRPARGP
jgi:hypothetical protein